MIDQATVDRIMDATQIVDVVSDFVTLRKRGGNYIGLCPFHDDRTPSFYVSPAKGIYKCFACGKGGNAVRFIMEHEQIQYTEALKYLARKYGIEVKEKEMTDEERQAQSERESLYIINQFARDYFHDTLMHSEEGRSIGMAYFRNRGFRDDIIEKFQLGYAPAARDAFNKAALAKGYNGKYMTATGLCYERDNGGLVDRFSGRVIFPWLSLSGKVVAFGGRVLDSRTKGVNQKYVNSPDSDIYHKDHELFGIYQAKKAMVKEDCVYMVEGYTDVISMHQCGIENVVANSGTALSTHQIKLLHRLTKNIVLLYDGDEAGIHAALRGTDMLLADGMNVKICLLPEGNDPDSFARSHTAAEYKDFIENNSTDFIRFKASLLLSQTQNDPIKRAQLITDITVSISMIPEAIVRDVYIKECAEMLNVEDKILVNEVAKYRERRAVQEAEKRERERRAAQGVLSQEETTAEATPADSTESNAPASTTPTNTENAGNDIQTPRDLRTLLAYPSPALRNAELQLLQSIVRYGDMVMCKVEEEDGGLYDLTVTEYAFHGLKDEGLTLYSPLARRILDEAMEHIHDKAFHAEQYFVNHQDPDISQLSVDLASDKYQLSKIHFKERKADTDADHLYELLTVQVDSYKYVMIGEQIKRIMGALKESSLQKDEQRSNALIEQYQQLKQRQNSLASVLGERVLNL